MRIKITPVISFEVQTEDGHALGLFEARGDVWNGMRELAQGHNKIIVSDPPDLFAEMMSFGTGKNESRTVAVVSATMGVFETMGSSAGKDPDDYAPPPPTEPVNASSD